MSNKWGKDTLFGIEQQILDKAKANLCRDDFKESPWYDAYNSLTRHYEKLLKQSKKLLRISDSQHGLLQKVQNDIRNLLDNAGQGFLTFGPDLVVNREYSSECVRIFGKKIENLNISNLLVPFGEQEVKEFITEVFQTTFHLKSQLEKEEELKRLPDQIEVQGRFVRLEYRAITRMTEDGSENVIMLVLTDITEKQVAQAQVEYLSCHDSLTGLYNRAYIDSKFSEFDREENLPLSMIMADINGLKLTNDVFGHQEGDRLLQKFSKVLLKCLREKELVARWGGDEFLIILPGSDEMVAESVCERIKMACRDNQADPIPLSVAMGIATRRNLKESISQLFSRAEDMMYSNKLKESRNVRQHIISGLESTLELRSFESPEHIKQVKDLALSLAESMGLSAQEKQELELLALLHDIGMITVPQKILMKTNGLLPDEWEIVQKHSEVGFRMAQSIGEYKIADSILAIHERWDGLGYPNRVDGINIPLNSRIIALVEAFDVMMRERPYRKALSIVEARQELERCSGTQFDPELVKFFLDMI